MRRAGFTLVEIMMVVAIIGLLASIAMPSFIRARNTAQQNACVNNLRQIENAKEQWALANSKSDGDTVNTASVSSYIKGSSGPACPSGGIYAFSNVGTNPHCTVQYPTSHQCP